MASSYLQGRVTRGQPLPRVVVAPVISGRNRDNEEDSQNRREIRTLVAFVVEMEAGLARMGMP